MAEQDNFSTEPAAVAALAYAYGGGPEPRPRHPAEIATRIRLTAREQFLLKFCEKHKVTIPSFEVMFAVQLAKCPAAIPLSRLAVFSRSSDWMGLPGGRAQVFEEISAYFGGDNFLNLESEVNPRQVEKVMLDILEFGSLLHAVKACAVTGVPGSLGYDPGVLQVWDGRHRMAALSILFGNFFDIPVEIYTMSYTEALQACVRSNDTRTIGKREKIKYLGLKDGADPRDAYRKKNGQVLPIAKWIAAHALGMVPDPVLRPFARVPVTDYLAGRKGISSTNFTNAIKEALGALDGSFSPHDLEPATLAVFNHIIDSVERTWLAIDRQSDGTKASSAWNAFSSIALGRVVGRAIQAWIGQPGRPTEADLNGFAEQAARVVMGFMDNLPERYARTPAAQLETAMLSFADTELGITLPGSGSS